VLNVVDEVIHRGTQSTCFLFVEDRPIRIVIDESDAASFQAEYGMMLFQKQSPGCEYVLRWLDSDVRTDPLSLEAPMDHLFVIDRATVGALLSNVASYPGLRPWVPRDHH
jgi:hypothetical protein